MTAMFAHVETLFVLNIILLMIFSTFFSATIISFGSGNRMLDKYHEPVTLSERILRRCYEHSEGILRTMHFAKSAVLVLLVIFFSYFMNSTVFAGIHVALAFLADAILSAFLILFTTELLPRSLLNRNSHKLLMILVIPASVLYLILWPFCFLINTIYHFVLKLFGVQVDHRSSNEGFSKDDLDELVQSTIQNASNEDDIKSEMKIFQNTLDFSEIQVRDCMIPRTEINSVDIDTSTIDGLMQMFIETGHSKIIVYKEDIDHIQGYIHSSEMFKNSATWKQEIRSMPFVPETMSAQKLMQKLLLQKKSLAVVVDEFGGTSGLVSLEDIVEEIFGDIEDEHDNDKYILKQTGEAEFILSARLEIEKVNDTFGLNLPESDNYMTVGGLILDRYQSFPKLNEIIQIDKFEFKILKKTMTKIELVQLNIKSDNG